MPVSPSNAAALARAVASEYEKAERVMVARIARNLAKGIDGPRWAEEKLAQLRAYRKEMVALITDLNREAKTGATTALTEAYKQGGLAAVDEMARFGTPGLEPLAGAKSLEKLLSETLGYLGSMNKRILRVAMDAYRDAVAAGVDQVLLGTMTRRQASQSVLDAFARKGVAPLFDKAGRAMNMIGYAEMAVRTGAMNASFAGHLESLQSFGMDLVIVSEDGSPCERCAPWEGEILSISGGNTQYATVDDAMEDIGHPNCEHTFSAYQEGVTKLYPPKTDEERAAQAQSYKDSQNLRGIERQIRAAKLQEAAAMDSAARQTAAQRVAYYQAKARDLVKSTSQVRQYAREQIGKAV